MESAQLVAPHDTETGDIAEEVKKRRQIRPDELEDAESQAQAETQSADASQEYKPGDLPVSDDPTSHTLHAETYRTHSVDYGKAFADTAVTGKVSRPRAERQIDGESVLERAAETSAEMPDLDGDAQLPDGLNGWSENLRRRMSVWMPPVRSCPPRRC